MTAGPETRPVRVVLQQRHELFRAGLALLLPADHAIEVVGSVTTAEQLLALCGRARPVPDVALVDGDADPAALVVVTGALHRRHPGLVLVALAVRRGTGRGLRRAGFDVVVDRGAGVAAIVETVLRTAGRATAATIPTFGLGRAMLSERESEVLCLLGQGLTVRAISERLAISSKTVEHHKCNIFEKLQTHNKAHAVSVAVRRGLLAVGRLQGRA